MLTSKTTCTPSHCKSHVHDTMPLAPPAGYYLFPKANSVTCIQKPSAPPVYKSHQRHLHAAISLTSCQERRPHPSTTYSLPDDLFMHQQAEPRPNLNRKLVTFQGRFS
eukprot:GHVR01100538.1.p1 GENE.GHVR01100538.1~~GHVR01100538.1.p1  ORF type:complete len:108 (-),score=6.04 GHVR01100538.1:204-527(-)